MDKRNSSAKTHPKPTYPCSLKKQPPIALLLKRNTDRRIAREHRRIRQQLQYFNMKPTPTIFLEVVLLIHRHRDYTNTLPTDR